MSVGSAGDVGTGDGADSAGMVAVPEDSAGADVGGSVAVSEGDAAAGASVAVAAAEMVGEGGIAVDWVGPPGEPEQAARLAAIKRLTIKRTTTEPAERGAHCRGPAVSGIRAGCWLMDDLVLNTSAMIPEAH